VLVDGQPRTFHIPARLVPKVRRQVEMRRRFEATVAALCANNLKRFLVEKENA
jgi:hypothetical protein